jgi:cysteine desulfurase
MTINGAKLHAPTGSAALYVRSGIRLAPQVFGGDQERGLRAGTENVAGAVALARALELATPEHAQTVCLLRDYAFEQLSQHMKGALLLGATGDERIAHNVCIALPGVNSEELVLRLDAQGVAVSSGSACTSHYTGPSHVVQAIGVPVSHANGVLRITLSRMNTRSEIDTLVQALRGLLETGLFS